MTMLDIDSQVAGRLRRLRGDRQLTLDGLAARSAVSRAMLSRIERGESSPTAQLLARICGGLGVPVAALFAEHERHEPVARRAAQPVWRDPASGYLRRAVSPAVEGGPALAEVTLPARASVAFDAMGLAETVQLVWLLEGALDVSVDERCHRLDPGDCLAMTLAGPVRFANPTDAACRYAVATARGAPDP